jgi:hypothetical protein
MYILFCCTIQGTGSDDKGATNKPQPLASKPQAAPAASSPKARLVISPAEQDSVVDMDEGDEVRLWHSCA